MIVIIIKIIIVSNIKSTLLLYKRIKNIKNFSMKFLSYFTVWAIDRRIYRFSVTILILSVYNVYESLTS